MKTKLAKLLEPGDRVEAEDGSPLEVKSVSRGFARFEDGSSEYACGSVFVEWAGGDWSQISRKQEIVLV